MSGEVREACKWLADLLESPPEFRKKIKQAILEWISRDGYKKQPTERGKELVEELEDRSKFEFIGFCPNIMYAKATGNQKELSSLWVHPWGAPTLAYVSKKYNMIVLTNPGIRYNDTILNEMEFKKENFSLLGITG